MRVPRFVAAILRRSGVLKVEFDTLFVSEAPLDEELVRGRVFVERRAGTVKWVHFRCPLCGEGIQLPIGTRPDSWRIKIDAFWRPTISPSVWETGSCQAHFHMIFGNVHWTRDSPKPR